MIGLSAAAPKRGMNHDELTRLLNQRRAETMKHGFANSTLPADLVSRAISIMDAAYHKGTLSGAPGTSSNMEMNAAEAVDAPATTSSTMQSGQNMEMGAAAAVNAPATSSSTWQSGPNVEMSAAEAAHAPATSSSSRGLFTSFRAYFCPT